MNRFDCGRQSSAFSVHKKEAVVCPLLAVSSMGRCNAILDQGGALP